MANRYTTTIGSREYIGESLSSINFNFDKLQTIACTLCATLGEVTEFGVNSVIGGPGISIKTLNQEVTATREDCPKWYINQRKVPLLSENNNSVSLANTLSADFLKHIQDVTGYNVSLKNMSTVVGFVSGINNTSTVNAFRGGVRMLDGKVFIPRFNSADSYLFDYRKSFSQTVGGFGVTLSAFWGGVLLSNGKVFAVPFNNTSAAIYNINEVGANRVTFVPWPNIVSGAFIGGTLLPDGRVLLCPHNMTSYGVYNPRTNTASNFAMPTTTPQSVYGCCLSPNGKVLFIPYNTDKFWVLRNNTVYTANTLTDPVLGAFRGGVLLRTGEIFCIPYNSLKAAIYNPVTDAVRYTGNVFIGTAMYEGGTLLPDGRILLVAANGKNAVIFDTVTEEFETPNIDSFNKSYYGCTLLDNNRVFLFPSNSNTGVVLSIPCTESFHYSVLNSPFLNKL
jgi:hypothetical protein